MAQLVSIPASSISYMLAVLSIMKDRENVRRVTAGEDNRPE